MIAFVTPLRGRVVIREIRPDRTGSIWHPDQAQDPKARREVAPRDRHGDRCSDALVAD